MFAALCTSNGEVFSASQFSELSVGQRGILRETLVCTACHADAYFIREARNGRSACFGARPHVEGCELASLGTEDGGSGSLEEADEITAADALRLEPERSRGVLHVRHVPGGELHSGTARRHTRPTRGGTRIAGISMSRLLRRLLREPEFRESRTKIIINDNSRAVVKDYCVHVADADETHVRKKRLYWGTFRFPRPADGGGAWLNTGRDSPTVFANEELLEEILASRGIDDLEDLTGASFLLLDTLRLSSHSDRAFLFPKSLDWFTIRLYDEDAEVG